MTDLPQPECLCDGLWRVGGDSWNGTLDHELSVPGDANVYLLRGDDGQAVLIDCGTVAGRARIEENLRHVGVASTDLRELLLTHSHWDHSEAAHCWQSEHQLRIHLNGAGADYLRRGDLRLVGAPLHGPEYQFQPFRVDHPVSHGETFTLAGYEVTAWFLPGHTLDSTLYTFSLAGRRVGVCGDIAFGRSEDGTFSIGLMSGLWGSDLDQYVASLEQLARVELDLLVPGHGGPVVGGAAVGEAVAGTLATARHLAGDPAVRRNTDF